MASKLATSVVKACRLSPARSVQHNQAYLQIQEAMHESMDQLSAMVSHDDSINCDRETLVVQTKMLRESMDLIESSLGSVSHAE